MLVVPVDDDPLDGRTVALTELGNLELLLPATGTAFRSEIDAAVKTAGVRLRGRAELDGVRLIASLTFEGYGPAISLHPVPKQLRPRFRLVPVDGLPPRQVGLAVRSRGLLSAPAHAVAEALRRKVNDPEGLPEGLRPLSATGPSVEGSLRLVARRTAEAAQAAGSGVGTAQERHHQLLGFVPRLLRVVGLGHVQAGLPECAGQHQRQRGGAATARAHRRAWPCAARPAT